MIYVIFLRLRLLVLFQFMQVTSYPIDVQHPLTKLLTIYCLELAWLLAPGAFFEHQLHCISISYRQFHDSCIDYEMGYMLEFGNECQSADMQIWSVQIMQDSLGPC